MLDRARLHEAFERLGRDLADRGLFIEIAVYGGSALMMQFAWRRTTEDVDAVVREGYDERALKPSVEVVARAMDLDLDWLNDAVGMFTPLEEGDDLFDLSGQYPASGQPGLRVLLANPRYLLAMKLQALRSLDRGDRDLDDARRLAVHLGVRDEDQLRTLYRDIFGEPAHPQADLRFRSVLPDR